MKRFKVIQREFYEYKPPYIEDYRSGRFGVFAFSMREYAPIHEALSVILGFERLRSARVLEIGAHRGLYAHYLKYQVGVQNIVCLDVDRNSVDCARKAGLEYVEADARKMPFPDGDFDIVLANCLFHTIPILVPLGIVASDSPSFIVKPRLDPEGFQDDINREVHRVLRPGGHFFSHGDFIEPGRVLPLFSSFTEITFPKTRSSMEEKVNVMQKDQVDDLQEGAI
jgi:SAM-dependent methyltransferase